MDGIIQSTAVFTPNQTPTYTYVERQKNFELELKNALRTPNMIISISGPSKSGKSVLLQRVVGPDQLIRIFGAQIKSPDGLWDAVFDWMRSPNKRSVECLHQPRAVRLHQLERPVSSQLVGDLN
jgi:hypothetical protein